MMIPFWLYLQHGGNYGYYPAPGSDILSLDVDNAEAFHAAGGKDLVRETFRYSAWPDWHKCPGNDLLSGYPGPLPGA